MALIEAKKSIIVAADVSSIADLKKLASAVKGVSGISGFKLGFDLGLDGLARCDRRCGAGRHRLELFSVARVTSHRGFTGDTHARGGGRRGNGPCSA